MTSIHGRVLVAADPDVVQPTALLNSDLLISVCEKCVLSIESQAPKCLATVLIDMHPPDVVP